VISPEPRTEAGRAGLAALLADPAGALVALDFDGTLAPIVARPEESRLAPGALAALPHLARAVGHLSLLTGRAAATAVELGELDDVPGLTVLGQYGAERWTGGHLELTEPPPGVAAVRAELPRLLADADPQVWVEDKNLSLVVHTRRAADPAGTLEQLRPAVSELATRHGLEANSGRYVLELRPSGVDKGSTLRVYAAEVGATSVTFAGDDVGDLPAYEAIEEMREAGVPGLTVCSESGEVPEVAARADLVLPGPPGVVAWLEAVARSVDGDARATPA